MSRAVQGRHRRRMTFTPLVAGALEFSSSELAGLAALLIVGAVVFSLPVTLPLAFAFSHRQRRTGQPWRGAAFAGWLAGAGVYLGATLAAPYLPIVFAPFLLAAAITWTWAYLLYRS